jgi:hypothetical protein
MRLKTSESDVDFTNLAGVTEECNIDITGEFSRN